MVRVGVMMVSLNMRRVQGWHMLDMAWLIWLLSRSCWLGEIRSRIREDLLRCLLGSGGMAIMSIREEDMRRLLSEV